MMVKILFTTSVWPTSSLIRWVTGDDCSHCVLYQDGEVIHSSFKGVVRQPVREFLKTNKVLHAVGVKGLDIDLKVLEEKYKDSGYDYGALFYLALRAAFPLVPKVNLWQTSGMFLCTEFLTHVIKEEEDSLITPHQLYAKLTKGAL